MASTVKTFAATSTWICPPGVTTIKAECWGGGGAGGGSTVNNNGGGGGAGGQYSVGNTVSVSAGTTYTITVGATQAGTTGNGSAGNDSSFSTLVVAKGGAGGTGNNGAGGTGSTTGGVGDTVNRGGSGSAGAASTRSGGGGGGAGSGGNGGDTTASVTGGTGTATGGGNGGTGLAAGANANGGNGSTFGGGGAGGYRTTTTSRSGGSGAAGQVKLTYTTPLMEKLVDTFPGVALDTTKWVDGSFNGGTQAVAATILTLTPAALTASTGAEIDAIEFYDLTGSYTLANVSLTALQNAETILKVVLDANNSFYFDKIGANLTAVKQIANVFTTIATITYNSTTMAWWRIRESAGTTFWDYSSDSITWTNLFNVANLLTVTSLQPILQVFDGSSDAAPGTAHYQNYNNPSSVTTTNSSHSMMTGMGM